MDKSKIEDVETWLSEEQARFINQVIELDNLITKHDDSWEKGIGSSGRTVVLSDGSIFEKIAVNYSSITGDSLPEAASAKRTDWRMGRPGQWICASLTVGGARFGLTLSSKIEKQQGFGQC